MFYRCLAAALLATPALAQLECDDVELLPLDVFHGTSSVGAPWPVRNAVLAEDLAVLDSPQEPVGTVGETGSLYVHRRTPSGWVLDQRLDLFDTLSPQTGLVAFADRWDASASAIFARYRDGAQPGSPHRIAVFERVQGVWQKTWTIDSDPAFFETGTFGSWIAVEGDRLVVGSHDSIAFQGFAAGTIETFERNGLGHWVRADLTTGVNLDPEEPHAVDLGGDRLAALDESDLYVLERIPTGWQVEHVVDLSTMPTGNGVQRGASLSLTAERLIVGGYYDAPTFVYDLNAGATLPMVQEIDAYEYPARDFNPPYASIVAAEGDFLAVGVGEDSVGRPTIRLFEWVGDEYHAFDALRAGAGVAAVALDDGRALLAAPWLDPSSAFVADARLEVRRVDGARAVPYCFEVATLLAAGSGAAPFDDATVHGYDMPPGATALIVAGASAGTTPFGPVSLCIDPGGGLVRFGSPVAAGAIGSFVVETQGLDLSALSQWLVAGGSFHLQAVYRDGGAIRTTNALRITLCD